METVFGIPIVLIIWWIIWASRTSNDSEMYGSEANNSFMQANSLNFEDQLAVFARLSREGHAGALASYTWKCLQKGRHAEAIDLYNETRMSLTTDAGNRLGWELANCDSNQALNLMAVGSSPEDVRHLWDRNVRMNHNECNFYSLLLKVREGSATKEQMRTLSGALKRDLRATLTSGKSTQGWYQEWCTKVLTEFGDVL